MGAHNIFSIGNDCSGIMNIGNVNPVPNLYEIIKYEKIGDYCRVLIKYKDCTNFEGNKILVYNNEEYLYLQKRNWIDPHFSNLDSPIARFIPTDFGWHAAGEFCKQIENIVKNYKERN